MAKYRGEIALKRKEIADSIADLVRNKIVVDRENGSDAKDLGDEIRFQRARQRVLDWCLTATEVQIRALRVQHQQNLPVELRGPIAGSLRGLRQKRISQLVYSELLRYAVGEHPGQQGRPLADDVLTNAQINAVAASVNDAPSIDPRPNEIPDDDYPSDPLNP